MNNPYREDSEAAASYTRGHQDGFIEGERATTKARDAYDLAQKKLWLTAARKSGIVGLSTSMCLGLYVAHMFEVGTHYVMASVLACYVLAALVVSSEVVASS